MQNSAPMRPPSSDAARESMPASISGVSLSTADPSKDDTMDVICPSMALDEVALVVGADLDTVTGGSGT